jgi:hypothetical protein
MRKTSSNFIGAYNGYRCSAGELYAARRVVFKINVLGTSYENVTVLILGMSPRENLNDDSYVARQIDSYQVLITRPDGQIKIDKYFRFGSPPWHNNPRRIA